MYPPVQHDDTPRGEHHAAHLVALALKLMCLMAVVVTLAALGIVAHVVGAPVVRITEIVSVALVARRTG